MEQIKKYFKQVLQDTNGSYSSKRLVTLISAILIAVGFVANLFYDQDIDQFIFEAVMYIVIAGLGISGAERFAPNKNNSAE